MATVQDPYLVLKSVAIPVHKASSFSEPITVASRVESNCHSIIIKNTGTSKMMVNGQPFTQGEFYAFTPPVLNVIDVTRYDITFDNVGLNEAWVTRSVIDFCFNDK